MIIMLSLVESHVVERVSAAGWRAPVAELTGAREAREGAGIYG
jgi:hypothetical protein